METGRRFHGRCRSQRDKCTQKANPSWISKCTSMATKRFRDQESNSPRPPHDGPPLSYDPVSDFYTYFLLPPKSVTDMKLAQTLLRRGLPLMAKRTAFNVKPTFLLRSALPATTSMRGPRFFSSEAQSHLIDILGREEKEEKDSGNLKMPEELATLKTTLESNWKIVEDNASLTMFLKDKKVQVSFHCQDTVEADPSYDEAEDEDEEPVSAVRFCVTASKAGKTLVISCVSEFGEAKIEGVMTTTSPPDAIHANEGNLTEKNQYHGPDFLDLAEDLQDAFAKYLEDECAVDSDVAAFVAMYADYQEQMQYVKFLKDAQLVIS